MNRGIRGSDSLLDDASFRRAALSCHAADDSKINAPELASEVERYLN